MKTTIRFTSFASLILSIMLIPMGCSKKKAGGSNSSTDGSTPVQTGTGSQGPDAGPPSVGFLNYEGLPRKLMSALHVSLSDTNLTTTQQLQLRQDLDNFKKRMCIESDASALDSTACSFAKVQMEVRLCGVAVDKECSKNPDFRYYLKGICLPSNIGLSVTQVTNSNDPVLITQKDPDSVKDYINRLSKEFHGVEADDAKKAKYLQLWSDTANDLVGDAKFIGNNCTSITGVVNSPCTPADRVRAASRMLCVAMAESLEFTTY